MTRFMITVSSSPFRFGIDYTLGPYRWRWFAWLRAWLHVQARPYAAANIVEFPRARIVGGRR